MQQVKTDRFPTLQIVCILLLVAVLVGILLGEILRAGNDLTLTKAAVTTLEHRVSGAAYLFAEETVLPTPAESSICFDRASGTPVTAGDTPISVYPVGHRADAPTLTRELSLKILLLKDMASNPEPWQKDYLEAYRAFMAASNASIAVDLIAGMQPLQAALLAGQLTADLLQTEIDKQQAALDSLLADVREQVERPAISVDGIFTHRTDGLEGILTPDQLDTLTPRELTLLLDSAIAPSKGGKVVSGACFLAMPISAADVADAVVGNTYTLTLADGRQIPAALRRMSTPDSDGRVLLVFALPEGASLCGMRRVDLSFAVRADEGIALPMAALYEEAGKRFVYVNVAGCASRRDLEILHCRDGYCLVADSGREGYLHAGEEIVLTARRIYDGKALNIP